MRGAPANKGLLKHQVFYSRGRTCQESNPPFTWADLTQTHVWVREVAADDQDGSYCLMQAEKWSPTGQAREYILSLSLLHTSMYPGDVLHGEDGRYWECLPWDGWREAMPA